MNGFSKFICGLSFLGLIGGGITIGVGFALGAKTDEVFDLKLKNQNISHTYSRDEVAEKSVIKVALINADISIVPSHDDDIHYRFVGESLYEINDDVPLVVEEKGSLSFTSFSVYSYISNIGFFRRGGDFELQIPSWSTYDFQISTVNGSIRSTVSNFPSRVSLRSVNGSVYASNLTSLNEVFLHTVNGSLHFNTAARISEKQSISCTTVNGNVKGEVYDDYKYEARAVNGSENHPTSILNCENTFICSTTNGSINITKHR